VRLLLVEEAPCDEKLNRSQRRLESGSLLGLPERPARTATFGEGLRHHRESLGLTQRTLASQKSPPRDALSRDGDTDPTPSVAARLGRGLQFTRFACHVRGVPEASY
jgi:hypothetical protein